MIKCAIIAVHFYAVYLLFGDWSRPEYVFLRAEITVVQPTESNQNLFRSSTKPQPGVFKIVTRIELSLNIVCYVCKIRSKSTLRSLSPVLEKKISTLVFRLRLVTWILTLTNYVQFWAMNKRILENFRRIN